MKKIGSVKEDLTTEKRISITPETVKKFTDSNFSIFLEKKYGEHLGITDDEYKNEGATLYDSAKEVLEKSQIILKVNCQSSDEINLIKDKSILIGQFDPLSNKETINKLIKKNTDMQNNKLIAVGLALILSSILAYSLFGSDQEQQAEIAEIGAEETVKEFELSILDRKLILDNRLIDPIIISVDVGDIILLRIQTDEVMMFHIHEYDHEVMVMPGKIEELSFPVIIPGRFEIEIHEHRDEEYGIIVGILEVMPKA